MKGIERAEFVEEHSEDEGKGNNHGRKHEGSQGQDPFHATFGRAIMMSARFKILLTVPICLVIPFSSILIQIYSAMWQIVLFFIKVTTTMSPINRCLRKNSKIKNLSFLLAQLKEFFLRLSLTLLTLTLTLSLTPSLTLLTKFLLMFQALFLTPLVSSSPTQVSILQRF